MREVVDGGAGDLGVEQEAGALDRLAGEDAKRRQHADASVRKLRLRR